MEAVMARKEGIIGAVDIGGTKIAVGIVADEGRLLAKVACPTDPDAGYSNAMDRVRKMLGTLAAQVGIEIRGIGIGSTGPVNPVSGEFGDVNFFPQWRGQNPVRDLERAFGVTAAIENDADAAALGEAAWGASKNKSPLLYVTVGTGIGVGVILDGRVYRGVGGAHPEIGHHLVDPSGPPCVCGLSGCWESLAAGPGMAAWFDRNAPPEHPRIDAKRLCESARQGDPWAQRALAHETRYLGLGLANLVTMFVPEAIVLGGSVMKSAPLFLDGIRKIIVSSCGLVPHAQTELTLASLGEDSNLIGAARVWHNRFGRKETPRAS
jgi:glucokinase